MTSSHMEFIPRYSESHDLIDTLVNMLKQYLESHCQVGLNYVKVAFLVERNSLAQEINQWLVGPNNDFQPYMVGDYIPMASAAPRVTDQGLECALFFTDDLIAELNTPEALPDVMSGVLEEVLHIQEYAMTWHEYHRLFPCVDYDIACELQRVAGFMIDEFLVNTRKLRILQTEYVVQHPDGHKEPLRVYYGGDICETLRTAGQKFGAFDVDNFEVDDIHQVHDLLNIVKRGFFEPLTRYSMYEFVYGVDDTIVISNYRDSDYYQEYLAQYWEPILEILQNTNTKNKECSIAQVADILESFLISVGLPIRTQ